MTHPPVGSCPNARYPIEKYIGLIDMSPYFIFDCGVIPHFGKTMNYLNILPRNQQKLRAEKWFKMTNKKILESAMRVLMS